MSTQTVADHWAKGDVCDLIVSALENASKSLENLTVEDLAPVDHFHARGFAATVARGASAPGGMLMSIRIVRLGSDRFPKEGLRIGTVRRPPRGVPKSEFASGNWYDVWLPNLSPSPETVKLGLRARSEREWKAFVRRYRAEMARPENGRVIDMLAALSHQTNFSVGCYCEDERRCHRSVLRDLLRERGAEVA